MIKIEQIKTFFSNIFSGKKWLLMIPFIILLILIVTLVSCHLKVEKKVPETTTTTTKATTTTTTSTSSATSTTAASTTATTSTTTASTAPTTTKAPAGMEPSQPTTTPQPFATAKGPLNVVGNKLVNSSGTPVQLRGISTHGINWFPSYVNQELFNQFANEWQADVLRLAMYTADYNGYCTGGNQAELKNLVKKGVEYATNSGMYVIIDWHILSDGNPNTYVNQAKEFFKEMSALYAGYDNVFYEICNEPNGGTSWAEIKKYALEIIPVIRANDPDGIILVGTPNWSQYVDQAATDPITGYSNIMYTLHYYAATHKEDLRNTMTVAFNSGLPIFVTEYGICDASGNGAIDAAQANSWVDTMNSLGISYVAWNISNKNETSAIFQSSCNKTSGITIQDLSASGKWLYHMLRKGGSP